MNFDNILFLAAGAGMAFFVDWLITFWRNAENQHARQEAEAILAKHELSAHLYMPGAGVDDPVLHNTLDRIAFTGQIVVDKTGNVVGKLMPKAQQGTQPHLRLVVDNSK